MTKQTILPKIPSVLIRMALHDLAIVRKDKRYEIDNFYWHEPQKDENKCYACLAGAVMANTLGALPTDNLMPSNFGKNKRQLVAIDCLRRGAVDEAFFELGIRLKNPYELNRYITDYADNYRDFRSDMLRLARDLKKAGY